MFLQKKTYYVEELTTQFVEKINNFASSNNLDIDIIIVITMYADETPALVFDRDFINLVSKLNGLVNVELYHYD